MTHRVRPVIGHARRRLSLSPLHAASVARPMHRRLHWPRRPTTARRRRIRNPSGAALLCLFGPNSFGTPSYSLPCQPACPWCRWQHTAVRAGTPGAPAPPSSPGSPASAERRSRSSWAGMGWLRVECCVSSRIPRRWWFAECRWPDPERGRRRRRVVARVRGWADADRCRRRRRRVRHVVGRARTGRGGRQRGPTGDERFEHPGGAGRRRRRRRRLRLDARLRRPGRVRHRWVQRHLGWRQWGRPVRRHRHGYSHHGLSRRRRRRRRICRRGRWRRRRARLHEHRHRGWRWRRRRIQLRRPLGARLERVRRAECTVSKRPGRR